MLTYPIIIGLQQSLVFIRHALNSEHALIMHSNTYKHSNAWLFSDLMKCSVEHESLSKNNWCVLSKRKRLWIKYNTTECRNLHTKNSLCLIGQYLSLPGCTSSIVCGQPLVMYICSICWSASWHIAALMSSMDVHTGISTVVPIVFTLTFMLMISRSVFCMVVMG